MEHDTDDAATRVTPEPAVMRSTPGTLVLVRDGRTTTGPVTIVHPPGTTPPATVTHHCGPGCGRRP